MASPAVDNTASDNTASDNTASDNTASDNTASDNTAPDNTELVPGISAGWLDIWRRIFNIAAIGVPLIVGGTLQALGVPGPVLGTIMFTLFVVGFAAALYTGSRVNRTMRKEMEVGYSTLYDIADFELRDARTKQLLRAENEKPNGAARRSLLQSMLTVKPSTLVAKKLEQHDES